MQIKALLIWMVRSQFGRILIGWILSHMEFTLPIKRLAETPTLLAFYHPAPVYPVHILLVPRKPYASLMDISDDDTHFLTDLITTAKKLVKDLGLEEAGYRLITNGGEYQDVPYLHFHLVSGALIKS
jgi:histidine triad (HIT) family protein